MALEAGGPGPRDPRMDDVPGGRPAPGARGRPRYGRRGCTPSRILNILLPPSQDRYSEYHTPVPQWCSGERVHAASRFTQQQCASPTLNPSCSQRCGAMTRGFPRAPHSAAFVRVHTDEGLVGTGEPLLGYFIADAVPPLVDFFLPLLVGRDPAAIKALWREMYAAAVFWGRAGAGAAASSAASRWPCGTCAARPWVCQ